MEGLSQRQEEILRGNWELEKRFQARGYANFEDFVVDVLDIQVTLEAGGRATLRHPKVGYRVEIYWEYDKTKRSYTQRELRIVGEPDVGVDVFYEAGQSSGIYYARLWIELEGKGDEFGKKVPRKRPQVGKPLDADFYRRVLATYEQLKREVHPSPGIEVANRMHAHPGTVRTWLRRARELEKNQWHG